MADSSRRPPHRGWVDHVWIAAVAIGVTGLTALGQPSVQFSRSIFSGSEAVSPVAVDLLLSEPAGATLTVDLVRSGTALMPSDYSLSATQVTFLPGQSTGQVFLTIVNDTLIEPPPFETITLGLANPNGLTIGPISTFTYQIIDNDNRTWPTDVPVQSNVTVVDAVAANLGENSSGATLQPATEAEPAYLWIVKNNPSTLHRLAHGAGGTWGPSSGWPANGLTLRYVNGSSQYPGAPDAEGVTKAEWSDTSVYVCAERNGAGGSRLSILRYDTNGVTAGTTTRDAAREWVLTHVAGNADTVDETVAANEGFEGLTWIPDAYLVARQFRTDAGILYDPNAPEYSGHGSGLFVVALEADAVMYVYALKSDGTFKRVSKVTATGLQMIVALEFDRDTGLLWAACDNSVTACGNKHAVFEVNANPLSATAGRLVLRRVYNKPAQLTASSRNFEGLAIEPESACIDGRKRVFWVNDSGTPGLTLYQGSLPCGCGAIDSDADGASDCEDECPTDALKTYPGTCGCGWPDNALPGDFDLSGAVDGADIRDFASACVALATDAGALCAGDFNHDQTVNSLDVPGMVAALLAE